MIYLGVSTGVVVNYHYCMDRLASTQLFGKETKVCGKCGMHIDQSHGCCRDEVKVVKMDDDQRLAFSFVAAIQAPALPAPDYSDYFADFFPDALPPKNLTSHSPPLLNEQDTWLRNRVFRL